MTFLLYTGTSDAYLFTVDVKKVWITSLLIETANIWQNICSQKNQAAAEKGAASAFSLSQNDSILAKLTTHWRAVKGVAHFEINLNMIRVLTQGPGSTLPLC